MEQHRNESTRPRVTNAADAYAIARQALPEPGIGVLHLDRDGRLLGISSEARPHLPVQLALRHAVSWESSALLIAQLRIGDDPAPSPAELGATQALVRAARELGLRVLDRLDFTHGDYRSLRALGLL